MTGRAERAQAANLQLLIEAGVSEGGLEPPPPIRGLAPQASASAYSATRTCGTDRRPLDPTTLHGVAARPWTGRQAPGRSAAPRPAPTGHPAAPSGTQRHPTVLTRARPACAPSGRAPVAERPRAAPARGRAGERLRAPAAPAWSSPASGCPTAGPPGCAGARCEGGNRGHRCRRTSHGNRGRNGGTGTATSTPPYGLAAGAPVPLCGERCRRVGRFPPAERAD